MQIEVTTRHGSASDDVRAYVTRKSEKLVNLFERVTAIQVTIDFENQNLVRVEMLVDAEHKHDFVATGEGSDVIAIFDGVLHKMEQQIRRYKEKVQDHRRDRPLNELVTPEPSLEDSAEGDADSV